MAGRGCHRACRIILTGSWCRIKGSIYVYTVIIYSVYRLELAITTKLINSTDTLTGWRTVSRRVILPSIVCGNSIYIKHKLNWSEKRDTKDQCILYSQFVRKQFGFKNNKLIIHQSEITWHWLWSFFFCFGFVKSQALFIE